MTDPKPLTATDFLGQTYTVGDHVVYATTSGRSPVQKHAIVEKITTESRARYRWADFDGKERRIEEPYQYTKVGVRELSNARNFTRWDTEGKYDPETHTYGPSKPARVTYPMPENIVKVHP